MDAQDAPRRDGFVPPEVRGQHTSLDQAFSVLFEHGLPVLLPLVAGTPLAALLAVNLGGATSFWGIFFGSLAWSLGVLVITAALQVTGVVTLHPMSLVAGAGLIFAGTSALATRLSLGALDRDPCAPAGCGSAPDTVTAYLGEAVVTFGFLGWVLSTVTGIAAGVWAVAIVKHHA